MGYIKTITERDLDNARWHFNNNMRPSMEADREDYVKARVVIAYLLGRLRKME